MLQAGTSSGPWRLKGARVAPSPHLSVRGPDFGCLPLRARSSTNTAWTPGGQGTFQRVCQSQVFT